jgi:hypothetical protein
MYTEALDRIRSHIDRTNLRVATSQDDEEFILVDHNYNDLDSAVQTSVRLWDYETETHLWFKLTLEEED